MNNAEYEIAYKEVLEIIKYIPKEYYDKIPENDIKLFETKASKSYLFEYNPSKTLDEQNVSKLAKGIIAILLRDYLVNETQKEQIISIQKSYREKLEVEKRKKYSSSNIFGDSKKVIDDQIDSETKLIKKEKWYTRIFLIFKHILKK